MEIRRVEERDIPEIISFTTGTFEWGDYIPEVIEEWVDDPEGMVMVAVVAGKTVGVARTDLLTPTEAWAHGVRVNPDNRGEGIAGDLALSLIEWARDAGASVVRLLIEDANTASRRHVEKVGFRRTVEMVRAFRSVGEATANPQGNGVRRGPSTLVAKPGKVQDATLAMTSWASSDIGRAMRGLVGANWQFTKLTMAGTEDAARSGNLWEIGGGWAMTSTTTPWFHVAMVDTRPEDAYETFRALTDAANTRGAETLNVWIPALDWLIQSARRAGCDATPMSVWEYPL
jgi:RimJ/RimL family protein N-acetyltransferase